MVHNPAAFATNFNPRIGARQWDCLVHAMISKGDIGQLRLVPGDVLHATSARVAHYATCGLLSVGYVLDT